MAIKLQNTSQAVANNGVKMLVYGIAGAGKTTLAGTWDNSQTLILSSEGGMLTLADKKIDVIEIRSMDQLRDAFGYLRTKDGDKYSLVVLDSISEMAEVCLIEEQAKTADGRKAYKELADIIVNLIRAFRDLTGKHVLLIAKVERLRDDATGTIHYRPAAPGQKLPNELPYLVDVVMALRPARNEDGSIIRKLQTAPADGYEAKDRSRQLDVWEPPDLRLIINKIMGEK